MIFRKILKLFRNEKSKSKKKYEVIKNVDEHYKKQKDNQWFQDKLNTKKMCGEIINEREGRFLK